MDAERQMIIEELEVCRYSMEVELKPYPAKCTKRSQQLRQAGNKCDVSGGMDFMSNFMQREAHKHYTESIACALTDSEDLASAFESRSTLLLLMRKYKDCISDAERALAISQSDSFKIKLLCRKIECLTSLGSPESETTYGEVKSLLVKIEDKDRNAKTFKAMLDKARISVQNYRRIKTRPAGDKIPEQVRILSEKKGESPFDSISIEENKKYGRHWTAKRDFEVGEIVYVTEPYVKVPNLVMVHMYCSHCLTVCWSMIPCDNCNWSMFCSDKCKKEAWEKYHSLECGVVTQLLMNAQTHVVMDHQVLAVRALMLGIKECGSIGQLKTKLQAIHKCSDESTRGFKRDGKLECSGIEFLYTLNDEVSAEKSERFAKNSVLILIWLVKLFEKDLKVKNIKSLLENDDALFIGSLILKLDKIGIKNMYHLPGDFSLSYNAEIPRGYCICPVVSLLNHSCDPNAKNVITVTQKFILFALAPIKKGSQIFISYNETFFEAPRSNRRDWLKSEYNFKCRCSACKENWPTAEELTVMAEGSNHDYLSRIHPREMEFLTIEERTIKPIMDDDWESRDIRYNQKIINVIAKALTEARKHLKQPSIALWRLQDALNKAITKYYIDY